MGTQQRGRWVQPMETNSMTHSLIINTASGDPEAASRQNPYRQARYAEREASLREILSRAGSYGFDEIIVAGLWPSGLASDFRDITWVQVAPQRHNRWDGLLQRETGARFATGSTLTFCHDDHLPCDGYGKKLEGLSGEAWDLLVPERFHATTGKKLNNGQQDGYMGGHCYTMRRWLWAALPLTSAPDEWWDIWLTPRWLELGAKMVYSDVLQHHDLEATAEEL